MDDQHLSYIKVERSTTIEIIIKRVEYYETKGNGRYLETDKDIVYSQNNMLKDRVYSSFITRNAQFSQELMSMSACKAISEDMDVQLGAWMRIKTGANLVSGVTSDFSLNNDADKNFKNY